MLRLACLAPLGFWVAACNLADSFPSTRDAAAPRDMVALEFPDEGPPELDLAPDPNGDPCAPGAPLVRSYGPPDRPFPLQLDPMPDPLEHDNGSLARDPNTGYLKAQRIPTPPRVVWVPNRTDSTLGGTVSRLDATRVAEVARYATVTCRSLKAGSSAACDGMSGCCALDDAARYAARKAKLAEPGHQAIQRVGNGPTRVATDLNGDAFVENEGMNGQGQGSLTKIAGDIASCLDRNRSGRIDTSKDTNGDGWIDVDCNGDGQPDDLAGVQAKPCTNGKPQEFYGFDDECVLWTSNVFSSDAPPRALGLGSPLNIQGSLSDAWVGEPKAGAFVRIDGTAGLATDDATLPKDCLAGGGPTGVEIDSSNVAWVAPLGKGKLCYFDTTAPARTGVVRDQPGGPASGLGISLDPDLSVWLSGDAGIARYTPDRSNGFANLGAGWWTELAGTSGKGVRSDARTDAFHFVYACALDESGALQIPATLFPPMKKDQTIAPAKWPTITMPCYGVAIDADGNAWGSSRDTTTRALIDQNGAIAQPTVNGPPQKPSVCPRGDSCPSLGGEVVTRNTGVGSIALGTRPAPTYTVLVPGCRDAKGNPQRTDWGRLSWDSILTDGTEVAVTARTGHTSAWDAASWQGAQRVAIPAPSPQCLRQLVPPNAAPPGAGEVPDAWLELQFQFRSTSIYRSPKLRSFEVAYRCK